MCEIVEARSERRPKDLSQEIFVSDSESVFSVAIDDCFVISSEVVD